MSTDNGSNAHRDLGSLRIAREQRPASRPGRWPLVVAGVAVVAVLLLAWRLYAGSALAAPRVATGTALVERASTGADSVLTASGYVVARRKASVSARRAGRLVELNVEEGSRVSEGDVLARIESDDLAAHLVTLRSEASEAAARARHAQAQRDLARTEHDRAQRLFAAGVGSRTDSDVASDRLRAAEAGAEEAAAASTSARARVASAEVDLDYSTVRAPFSGLVLRKDAELGETVAPAVASGATTRGAIVTMADLDSLEVEVDVSESRIGLVRDGMPAEIVVDAIQDARLRGRVRQVIPTADRQKATVQVKVAFEDRDERVRPEMGAKVTFLSDEPDAAALQAPPLVTVPSRSVAVDGGAAVFVLEGGRVRRVPIVPGERRGDRVVVTDGLRGGETLVLDPPPTLSDGDPVRKEET